MDGGLASILMNLSFALGFISVRKIEGKLGSITINFIRTALGFLSFLLLAFILGNADYFPLLTPIHYLLLSGSIIFTVVIGDTSYFISQKHIGSASASAITVTTPLFTFIIEIIFMGQTFHWIFLISIIIVAAGVLILTFPGNHEEKFILSNKSRRKRLIGAIWGIITALAWSIGILLLDYSFQIIKTDIPLDPGFLMVAYAIRYFVATLFLCAIALATEKPHKITTLDKNAWKWLVLSSIFGVTLGTIFYGEAILSSSATVIAIFTTSLPLFIMPIAFIFNREKPSKYGILGIFTILAGILLLQLTL